MSKIFYPIKWSYYLGEQRPINQIVVGYQPDPSPSPTPTPSATPNPTPTPTPSVTPTLTPTPTTSPIPGSPTPTPTVTSTTTPTPTVTPTFTPTPSATPAPQGDFLLAETGDNLTDELGNLLEYNSSLQPILTGLERWWDSEVGISRNPFGYVDIWTDKKSSQTATSNTPNGYNNITLLNGYSGMTMLVDSEMTLATTLDLSEMTIFAVYKVDTTSSDGSYIMGSNDDGIAGYDPSNPGLFFNNDGAEVRGGTNTLSAQIGMWNYDNGNYEIRQNGSVVLSTLDAVSNMTFSSLFNKPTAIDGLLDGTIWEILVYNRTLTNDEKQLISVYLSNKYNLQLT